MLVAKGWIKRPRSPLRYRRRRATRRHPAEPRSRRGVERQRLTALALVSAWRAEIHVLAERHDVAADAIAGAVLWDALENPYRRPWLRLGPGKVHPFELGRRSDAERAEAAGLVPFTPGGTLGRLRLLRRPEGAFAYIAAILAYHAANYEAIAGVDIRADPAVLCTLYQGGASEARAARLARRRAREPGARPRAGDEMGPWVASHRVFIRGLLAQPAHDAEPGLGLSHRPARRVDARRLAVRVEQGDRVAQRGRIHARARTVRLVERTEDGHDNGEQRHDAAQ